MTKKDYEAFAKIIREAWPTRIARFRVAAPIADLCQKNNPRFDRERFYKACDVK